MFCLFKIPVLLVPQISKVKLISNVNRDSHSEDEDPEYKPLRMPFKDEMEDFTNSPLDDKDEHVDGEAEGKL